MRTGTLLLAILLALPCRAAQSRHDRQMERLDRGVVAVEAPGGVYVVTGGSMRQLFQAALQARRSHEVGSPKTYVVSLVHKQEDLIFLKGLLESGRVNPVIDGSYPLRRTDEAMRYFEETHARGKVVITVEHGSRE